MEESGIADAFLSLRAILFILFILSKTLVHLLGDFGNRPDASSASLAARTARCFERSHRSSSPAFPPESDLGRRPILSSHADTRSLRLNHECRPSGNLRPAKGQFDFVSVRPGLHRRE